MSVLNFFKRNTLDVDLFTTHAGVFDLAKPDKGSKFMPDWFKQGKYHYNPFDEYPIRTIRGCPAVTQHLSKSIAFPMWSDLSVKIQRINDEVKYMAIFADEDFDVEFHNQVQRYDILKNYLNLKMFNPWYIKADARFMLTPAIFHNTYPEDVTSYVGILDARSTPSLNNHLLFKLPDENQEREYEIKFRDVVFSLTPLTEKKIKLHHHLVSEQELKNLEKRSFYKVAFNNPYAKVEKQKAANKCPVTGWFK